MSSTEDENNYETTSSFTLFLNTVLKIKTLEQRNSANNIQRHASISNMIHTATVSQFGHVCCQLNVKMNSGETVKPGETLI